MVGKKAFSGFSVNSLEKAERFYGEILGLKVTKSEMGLLQLHTEGNQPIIIYQKPNHIPATFTILNFPVDDIEKAVDELTAKGVVFDIYGGDIATDKKGIFRSDKGPTIAWFRDPAKNILSLIEMK